MCSIVCTLDPLSLQVNELKRDSSDRPNASSFLLLLWHAKIFATGSLPSPPAFSWRRGLLCCSNPLLILLFFTITDMPPSCLPPSLVRSSSSTCLRCRREREVIDLCGLLPLDGALRCAGGGGAPKQQATIPSLRSIGERRPPPPPPPSTTTSWRRQTGVQGGGRSQCPLRPSVPPSSSSSPRERMRFRRRSSCCCHEGISQEEREVFWREKQGAPHTPLTCAQVCVCVCLQRRV